MENENNPQVIIATESGLKKPTRIGWKIAIAILILLLPWVARYWLSVYAFGCKYGLGCSEQWRYVTSIASYVLTLLLNTNIFFAIALLLPRRLKILKSLLWILPVLYILVSVIAAFVFNFSIEQYVENRKTESKCDSLPHSSLVSYCNVYFELEKNNPYACESIVEVPQEYVSYLYDDERLRHMKGFLGGVPTGGDEGVTLNRAKCYGMLAITFSEDDRKNLISPRVISDCQAIADEVVRNNCYFRIGSSSDVPLEEVDKCIVNYLGEWPQSENYCRYGKFLIEWKADACNRITSPLMREDCLKFGDNFGRWVPAE